MNDTEKLRDSIARAFTLSLEEPDVAREIAFHMTDWDHNVDDLVRLYDQPEAFSDNDIRNIVIRFLAHVPNHVAAAKKLAGLGPIEDVFEVGVLEDDE
ncbi:MAG: hypothetical protein ACRD9R_15480 [Pyrinomonadaceae bacterium]